MRLAVVSGLAAVALAGPAEAQLAPRAWFEWGMFARDWSFDIDGRDRVVLFGAWVGKGAERRRIWMARRMAIPPGMRSEVLTFADSRTCPQMEPVLAKLGDLPAPVIDPPAPQPMWQIMPPLDGAQYELEAPAIFQASSSGRVRLSGNVDTPLAKWVDEALAQWAPCWGPAEPHVEITPP